MTNRLREYVKIAEGAIKGWKYETYRMGRSGDGYMYVTFAFFADTGEYDHQMFHHTPVYMPFQSAEEARRADQA